VIAKSDNIGAGNENLVGQLGGKAHPVCCVLAVDDAEIDVELLFQAGEASLDRPPARRTKDIREKEDFQGIDSVAAG
jgi:hypothetical protein